MYAAIKFDIETPSSPRSRPSDWRKHTVIIACTAIFCILVIHLARYYAVAREESRPSREPGFRGFEGLKERLGAPGPAGPQDFGETCGGELDGDHGRFIFYASNQDQAETQSLPCLWIIQLLIETNFRFTLDALGEDSHLNLYAEDQLTSWSANNYTKLNWTKVGSSFEFLGKTLIVILPNSSASVAFSWHSIEHHEKNSSEATMKNSDYTSSPNVLLERGKAETVESLTWGINSNENFHVKWDLDAGTSCNITDNCTCLYFAIFQLTSKGILNETVKTCGPSSEGQLKGISGWIVVLIKENTKVEAEKFDVSWELDDVTTSRATSNTAQTSVI